MKNPLPIWLAAVRLFAAGLLAAGMLGAALVAVPLFARAQKSDTALFSLLNEKQTGISFSNNIREDDSLNVFSYEYLYNGAGIGIADLNGDGLDDIFFPATPAPINYCSTKELSNLRT
ncbi:MAG TPA: hypothetical protein VHE54_11750 [Puia sp.]|nr:hypothetical protein [Puia sp.]